jgi:hypothetical protein
MPNDNIVWPKGGTGLRGNADATPDVPEYGTSQPVLDTASDSMSSFGVQFPEKRGANPYQEGTADFMPDNGSIPENSTDVEDQNDGRNRGN